MSCSPSRQARSNRFRIARMPDDKQGKRRGLAGWFMRFVKDPLGRKAAAPKPPWWKFWAKR
jgi:hypothetical protein